MGKLQRANAAGQTIPPMVIYDTVNLSMVLVPMGGSTRNSLNDGSLSTLYKKLSLLALCSFIGMTQHSLPATGRMLCNGA